MKEAFTSPNLFAGWPQNAVPIPVWRQLLPITTIYIVGKMIATCPVQGGQPPVCFAAAVADYFVFDEVKSEPSLNDIPDHTVRDKLEKVCAKPCIL